MMRSGYSSRILEINRVPTRAGTTAHGVGDLEALKAVAAFCFFAYHVKNGVNKLSTFGVVALGPVITGASLAEHEVVGAEQLTERSRADRVHSTWLKVHQDSTGHIAAASCFVEVHVDAFQLQVTV